MIIDSSNCFQRNFSLLQDVCNHRVDMANFILSFPRDEEDASFYLSEIRHYRHYDV